MIDYQTTKQMKELGLMQRRHKNAKYYVTPDIIMDFEAIHDLKDAKAWGEKHFEEQVNWLEHFTYIPELIDLIGLQSYELTLDAAVFHFIENHKQEKGVEEAIAPMPEAVQVPKTDKQTVISDPTLERIEELKEAIKLNATQNPASTI